MAFNRRKEHERKDSKAKPDKPDNKAKPDKRSRDPFAHLGDERAEAESGDPWFLAPYEGPELHVETGISSNLSEDDLEQS